MKITHMITKIRTRISEAIHPLDIRAIESDLEKKTNELRIANTELVQLRDPLENADISDAKSYKFAIDGNQAGKAMARQVSKLNKQLRGSLETHAKALSELANGDYPIEAIRNDLLIISEQMTDVS